MFLKYFPEEKRITPYSLENQGLPDWLGRRPRVRGVVMNPVDHPMG